VISYAKQSIDENDVSAVLAVLCSDWLTTGPKVGEFERSFAGYVGTKHAVAVSSGTAALHAAMFAIGIGPGDEVIVPPMTFVATANCVLFEGGIPVFADVEQDTLLLDPDQVVAKITPNTKAIIGVDYGGQPCDWNTLREISDHYGLYLVDDACHALGAIYKGSKIGTLADLTVFSFHPAKHITTGEGGMVTTDNDELVSKIRMFRNHGITVDHKERKAKASWFYSINSLGYNYRITDLQCALGLSQMQKLPDWLTRRHEIAARYDEVLLNISGIYPLGLRKDVLSRSKEKFCEKGLLTSKHAYHLYVVRVLNEREKIFKSLHNAGIGVNVHYIPVHLHRYYRKRLGVGPGACPNAEDAFKEIMSLPIYPGLMENELEAVVECLVQVANY